LLLLPGCIEHQVAQNCAANTDCFTDLGYVCDAVTRICLRGCATGNECLATQACDTANSDPTRWVCRTKASGDSAGPGDVDMGDTAPPPKHCAMCNLPADCNTTEAARCNPDKCVCNNGVCELTPGTCTIACASTKYCEGGECLDKCTAAGGANPCPAGTGATCGADGRCECASNAECATPTTAGTCK
jgi:hypothetical protein